MINTLSSLIAAHAGTTLIEANPQIGDTFGPWIVEAPGKGEACWFYGSNPGFALASGTVVRLGQGGPTFILDGMRLKVFTAPQTD